MPDYKRTEGLFRDQGISHKYKKPQGQLDDELFYAKVANPNTGTFYHISDLPIEYRQNRQEQDKQYPIREVNQIVRIKRLDGTEWLKSKGRIVGLDRLGNEVEHSFTDPEVYFTPWAKYELKPKDPKNPDGPKERKCTEAGINNLSPEHTQYTLQFNAENFEQLYKQRPGQSPGTVSLVIYQEDSSERPRQITSPEKFKNTPFDELWEEVTTIKVKLDRSIKDQLQDRQYS
jgi:hypothetical protein